MIKNQSQSIRTQLEMSAEKVAELESMMQETELKTKKELFNYALTLLEWALKERREGRIIASIDEATNKIKELDMPIFETVMRKGK